jgi:uncharacterized membrane protein
MSPGVFGLAWNHVRGVASLAAAAAFTVALTV